MIFHHAQRPSRPIPLDAASIHEIAEARRFLQATTTPSAPAAAQFDEMLWRARRFAEGKAAAALKHLPPDVHGLMCRPVGTETGVSLLVAPGSLAALRVIAQAVTVGFCVLLEDCTFSRACCAGMIRSGQLETCPLHQLPGRAAAAMLAAAPLATLLVTFPDRPLLTYAGTIRMGSPCGEFFMSQADALLAALPYAARLHFGPTGTIVAETAGDADADEETRLQQRTRRYLESLCAQITHDPDTYLGWPGLSSRSLKYQQRLIGNGRSILKSLLLCSKIRGHWADDRRCAEMVGAIAQLPP